MNKVKYKVKDGVIIGYTVPNGVKTPKNIILGKTKIEEVKNNG